MARAQQNLPEIPQHSPENPEFQELCEDVRLFRAERIEIQRKEGDAVKKLIAYRGTMTTPPETFRYLDEDGKTRVARFKSEVKVSVRSEKSDDADDSVVDKGSEDNGGVDVA